MEAQIAAAGAGKGSLMAVSTATKAFVAAHPLSMAATGGAILALGSYYMLGRMFRKKAKAPVAVAA